MNEKLSELINPLSIDDEIIKLKQLRIESLRELIETMREQSAVLFTVPKVIDDLDLDDPNDELGNIGNLCFQANEAIEEVIEILERRLADLEKRLTEEAA